MRSLFKTPIPVIEFVFFEHFQYSQHIIVLVDKIEMLLISLYLVT